LCEANIVPTTQLYGGKIAAALSRQHPRDLFDVKYLDIPLSDCREGFIFCLLGSDRPIHESFAPTLIDQHDAMENQFSDMTDIPFTYEEFEETRAKLVNDASSGTASAGPDHAAIVALREPVEKVIASHAFMAAVPSLDLVLTPNGFGIVSNTNVVPASKERIERLQASLEAERDCNLEQLLLRLASRNDWQQSSQGKYFAATLFPSLGLCRRLAIREHIWDEYQHLHDRLIKIENVLAETYFSQEQMTVFRQHVMNQIRYSRNMSSAPSSPMC
jgi:hypothetical protein